MLPVPARPEARDSRGRGVDALPPPPPPAPAAATVLRPCPGGSVGGPFVPGLLCGPHASESVGALSCHLPGFAPHEVLEIQRCFGSGSFSSFQWLRNDPHGSLTPHRGTPTFPPMATLNRAAMNRKLRVSSQMNVPKLFRRTEKRGCWLLGQL